MVPKPGFLRTSNSKNQCTTLEVPKQALCASAPTPFLPNIITSIVSMCRFLSWSSSIIHQYSLHGAWYDPLHSSNIIIHCSCLTCRSSWLTLSSLLGIPHLCQYLFLELWLFNRCLSLAFLSWVKLSSKKMSRFLSWKAWTIPIPIIPINWQSSNFSYPTLHFSRFFRPQTESWRSDCQSSARWLSRTSKSLGWQCTSARRWDYNRISRNHSKIYIAVNIWTLDIQN